MKEIVTGMDFLVAPWVMERTSGVWNPGRGVSIGLSEDGNLVAGVLYEDFNGANVMITVAAEGKNWLNREFLWFSFYYPFEQLKCKRITALIVSSNQDSIRFCEHLGFVHEATLKDAHPSGDILVFRMLKEDCRWLNFKGKKHGQRYENTRRS